jgi:hypothetical protein
MAINLTFTEALLLTTDLILIIIVVYLVDRLRKIKKNAKPAEEKQPSETAALLEVKPDISVVKIDKPEKAEIKPGDELTASASPANSEPAPRKDELEDRLLEELHAIPSEVKSEKETTEPGTLKLEDEPPGENPAGIEPGTPKQEKVRKPRKKKSKSRKTSSTGGAEQTLNGETEAAAGKKAGRKKKAAEQAGQLVEAKPAQEIVKEEKAEEIVKTEKVEELVKEETPEEPMEPQKETLF